MGTEDGEVGDDEDMDRGSMHRLCPTYAQDINSPLRHVRTRIYFTSESHVHSLMNVLRFAHLGTPPHPLNHKTQQLAPALHAGTAGRLPTFCLHLNTLSLVLKVADMHCSGLPCRHWPLAWFSIA